jgi:uncharacterized membrane protein (UPF0127 family)
LGIFLYSGGEISLFLKNIDTDEVISKTVIVANRFLTRLKGLMFTRELPPESSMFIYPCSGIHTFFMNYNIDVLYLDINNKILAVDEDMRPGRVGRIIKGAVAVVELSSGRIGQTKTKIGQTVRFVKRKEEN